MGVSLLHDTDLVLWVTLFMGMGLTLFLYKIFSHENIKKPIYYYTIKNKNLFNRYKDSKNLIFENL